MDLDHFFKTQSATLPPLSLTEAHRLMDRHLDGHLIDVPITHVRAALSAHGSTPFKTLPVGAQQDKRTLDYFAEPDAQRIKRAKEQVLLPPTSRVRGLDDILGLSLEQPASESRFRGTYEPDLSVRRSGVEWARAIADAQASFYPRALTYKRFSDGETRAFNESLFGSDVATNIAIRLDAFSVAFADVLTANLKDADKRVDRMTRALRAFDNLQRETIYHHGGATVAEKQTALDRFEEQRAHATVSHIADAIIAVFVAGNEDALLREQPADTAMHVKAFIALHIGEKNAAAKKVEPRDEEGFLPVYETSSDLEEAEEIIMGELYMTAQAAARLSAVPRFTLALLEDVWSKVQRTATWIGREAADIDTWQWEDEPEPAPQNRAAEWAAWMTRKVLSLLRFLIGAFLISATLVTAYSYLTSLFSAEGTFLDVKTQAEALIAKLKTSESDVDSLRTQIANEIAKQKNASVPRKMQDFATLFNHNVHHDPAIHEQFTVFVTHANGVVDRLIKEQEPLQSKYSETMITLLNDAKANFNEALRDNKSAEAISALEFIFTTGRGDPKNYTDSIILLENVYANLGGVASNVAQMQSDVKAAISTLEKGLEQMKLSASCTPLYTVFFNYVSESSALKYFADTVGVYLGRSFMGVLDACGLNAFREVEFTFFNVLHSVATAYKEASFIERTARMVNIAGLTYVALVAQVLNNSWVAGVLQAVLSGTSKALRVVNKALHFCVREAVLTALGDRGIYAESGFLGLSFNCSEATIRRIEGWVNKFFGVIHHSLGAFAPAVGLIVRSVSALQTISSLIAVVLPVLTLGGIQALLWGNAISMTLLAAGGVFMYVLQRYSGYSVVTHIANLFIFHPYASAFAMGVAQFAVVSVIQHVGLPEFSIRSIIPLEKSVIEFIDAGSLTSLIPQMNALITNPSAYSLM